MRETDVLIANHAFDLVKLSQVSGIECLIPKNAVNTEPFHWLKTINFCFLCHLEQHLGANCGSVSAQNILTGFFKRPSFPVAEAAIESVFVSLSNLLCVPFGASAIARDGIL